MEEQRLGIGGLGWLERLQAIRDKLASGTDTDLDVERQLMLMAGACVELALEETAHVDQTQRAVDRVTEMTADLVEDTHTTPRSSPS